MCDRLHSEIGESMALKLKSLSTRNAARDIAENAERFGHDEINLEGVEFISRSCADELVNQVEKRGLRIVEAEDNVAQMLDLVRSQ